MINMYQKYDVFAIGNAIVDFFCNVQDETLKRLNLNKGDMHFIENQPVEVWNLPKYPGGSSANVIAGLANLGLSTSFSCSMANDKIGRFFRQSLESLGVDVHFVIKKGDTASLIAFITPDGERTFSVSQGVMHSYTINNIPLRKIENSRMFHTSCYKLITNPMKESTIKAVEFAREGSAKISLDLAYPSFVEENRISLVNFIRKNVNIVFANEQEAKALNYPLEKLAEIVVYKMGNKGSLIVSGEKRIKIDADKTNVVNTTGAGDGYAAGFLYGMSKELELEVCGKIGSFYAAKIVGQEPARIKESIENIEELI